MQTFLPYADFAQSAAVLDMRRLGKQRVECKQILGALTGTTAGWRNHPATKMWQGYEQQLCNYAIAICEEWIIRGYNDSLLDHFHKMQATLLDPNPPWWLGDDRLHSSHRSNLIRKNPEHYQPLWPDEPSNIPYWWPTKVAP